MKKTPVDEVIDEIREVRRQISASVGHDPARLVAYYIDLQKQYQDRLLGVKKHPRKPPVHAKNADL